MLPSKPNPQLTQLLHRTPYRGERTLQGNAYSVITLVCNLLSLPTIVCPFVVGLSPELPRFLHRTPQLHQSTQRKVLPPLLRPLRPSSPQDINILLP